MEERNPRISLWKRRLQDCRADEPLIDRLAAVLGIVAVVLLSVTLLRMQVGYSFAAPQVSPPPLAPSPAEAATPWASIVAACMRGEHTGSDFAAFCHVVELGRVGR